MRFADTEGPNTRKNRMTVTLDYKPIRVIAHAKRTLDHRQQCKKPKFWPPRAAHGLKMRSSQQAQNECHEERARTIALERHTRVFNACHAAGARSTCQSNDRCPWSTTLTDEIRP